MGSASNVRSLARAELTAAARRALRGEASFSMRNEAMQPPCSAWFVEAKKNGLRDVTLVFSFLFKDSKAVLGQEFAAVICSYMNGKTTRVILDYSNEKGFFVDEQPVTLDSWKKPAFPDPVVGLRKALLDIASVARMGTPTDWWANMFMNAAYRLDSKNCEYDKQPGLFYLPQPYFKYLMVVQETHLGMGMGSWYDLPIVGEKQFRLATHEFEYQKCRALLYAVNNF
ncbi:MAG: hypothetical protein J5797_08115 [Prevotella sp.]|nr:hypothetical protein [Prevotella sp.]